MSQKPVYSNNAVASSSSLPQKRPLPIGLSSPVVTSPYHAPKRMSSVDEGSQHGESSGKKKRVSLSCAQCAKRKQKCNREFPCQHCIARKVPELCVPYNPQAARENAGPDANTASRLDNIENVLSVVLRHHGGLWRYKDVKDYMSTGSFQRLFPSSSPSTPASPGHKALTKATENHFALPSRPGSASSDHHHAVVTDGEEEGLGKDIRSGWMEDLEGGIPESMTERVNIKLDHHGNPAENLQRLITDCGVSPHKIAELVQELPPKHFADKIVNWFFSELNYLRTPIDERLFRKSYESLYDTSSAVDPADVQALPLIFIILATAVKLAPEEWAGSEETRKISSLRMYWSSRRSILIATAIQSESLELVISRLLSAMYLILMHDRRLTECWSQLGASLRTAQAIGLHRDGTKLGLDPFQTEYRRRIWSYLYHADKLYSLILGRPQSISDSYTDTLPPSNLELYDFPTSIDPSVPLPLPKPLHEPTSATFLILRKGFSKIIGRIVHHFQKLDAPAQYADVEGLQGEIDTFVESLPPHYTMHGPDRTLDNQYTWLPVHRFLLLSEIHMTTIILHRPWLLRKLSSNRYAQSRTACFEAAKLDFELRQDIKRVVPNYHIIAGAFRMFNGAMIAGISAIIDPRGPDADQMRRILTVFLEQNPWHETAKKDETTRKEVQIIHTLSRRAAQIYEDSFGPNKMDTQDKDSVALLLALRQPGDNNTQSGAYPRGMPPREDGPIPFAPTPRPWQATQHGVLANAGKAQQSPLSSTSHEDDHSQRLLDHWISANSSLAVGSFNAAPQTMAATANLGYLPMTTMDTPNPFLGFPQTQPSSSFTQQTPWQGEVDIPGDFILGTSFTSASAAGGENVPQSFTGPLQTTFGGGGEGGDNDEYWNALIDGILGTTGASAPA